MTPYEQFKIRVARRLAAKAGVEFDGSFVPSLSYIKHLKRLALAKEQSK
jgi:hypothetical protein